MDSALSVTLEVRASFLVKLRASEQARRTLCVSPGEQGVVRRSARYVPCLGQGFSAGGRSGRSVRLSCGVGER